MRGKVEGCSLQTFEDMTGLKLTDSTGIRDELPPITTFLNRLLALTIAMQGVLFTAFEQLLTAKVEGAIASGVYDVGLETLTAESFTVTERTTIYTHPATGAETRLLAISERRRNRPVTLAEAVDHLSDRRAVLLVNERSGRAAVQVPASSVMLDDGEIERRVRLIRPMEHTHASLAMMADSHWQEADRTTFAAVWNREVADVPPFVDSTIHIVTGTTSMTADAAYAALIDGRTILDLAEGLQLRRVRVMGTNRIELSGFTEAMHERLRAYGLFTEIISWKLRFFVAVDASGIAVLGRLLDSYAIARISDREAA